MYVFNLIFENFPNEESDFYHMLNIQTILFREQDWRETLIIFNSKFSSNFGFTYMKSIIHIESKFNLALKSPRQKIIYIFKYTLASKNVSKIKYHSFFPIFITVIVMHSKKIFCLPISKIFHYICISFFSYNPNNK